MTRTLDLKRDKVALSALNALKATLSTRGASTRGASTREVATALRDLWPVLLGLAPFAVLIGVASVRSGVGGAFGIVTAVAWLGGSAQLAAITLLAAGATPVAVLAAVVLVNARFLLYAAALEPRFRDQPGWFRWLAPHFVTDPSYGLAARRPELTGGPGFRRYWITTGTVLSAGWVAATVLGVLFAPVLPAGSALDVAAPAMFLAMLVPLLRAPPALAGAIAAAAVAVVASPLPHGVGLLAGMAAGVLAATVTEKKGTS